jgi:hypothetical protein
MKNKYLKELFIGAKFGFYYAITVMILFLIIIHSIDFTQWTK